AGSIQRGAALRAKFASVPTNSVLHQFSQYGSTLRDKSRAPASMLSPGDELISILANVHTTGSGLSFAAAENRTAAGSGAAIAAHSTPEVGARWFSNTSSRANS